jgi:hypothetical protein
MWQKVPDMIKRTWYQTISYAESFSLAGYDDWRLPTIKELYSIIDYCTGWPYLDTNYFYFEFDPIEDKNSQYWSSTEYVGLTHGGQETAFGVNFATGHIKGYPQGMRNFVRCVRGETYGENAFIDNGDGTVTDNATGLMWQQADDGATRNWEDALAYAESLTLAGYDDWRLPNDKELQSIVEYTHSPNAVNPSDLGPAIDTNFFSITELPPGTTIYDPDYGYFWTSTNAYHSPFEPEYYYAWYVAFGTASNDVAPTGEDLHGAGAVRFDAKTEEAPLIERIYNYVRCVRGGLLDTQPPEKPNTPIGPSSGNVGVQYTYTSSTSDPDGDQVYYWFDWDDGTNSGWIGPYNSGEETSASHTWARRGSYEIKVKAKDINGAQSEWSDPLPVTMPRTRNVNIFLHKLSLVLERIVGKFPILYLLCEELIRC